MDSVINEVKSNKVSFRPIELCKNYKVDISLEDKFDFAIEATNFKKSMLLNT